MSNGKRFAKLPSGLVIDLEHIGFIARKSLTEFIIVMNPAAEISPTMDLEGMDALQAAMDQYAGLLVIKAEPKGEAPKLVVKE